MLTGETKREAVIRKCTAILRIATQSADEKRESVYHAYSWAHDVLYGMATGYWAINEYELETVAEYYARIADNKAIKDLLNK